MAVFQLYSQISLPWQGEADGGLRAGHLASGVS
ncbi:MAG: hypothetical protein RLZZ490_1745 [Cyanobacteriota bacterium]